MIALLLIAALIIYGTLYPWTFDSGRTADLSRLLTSLRAPHTARMVADAVLNLLMYIPLGLSLFLQARRAFGGFMGAIATVLGSFSLSLCLEYAQFYQPTRVPNTLDILLNSLGGALGVVSARFWPKLAKRLRTPSGSAILLAPAWAVALFFPFIPALGLYALRGKIASAAAFNLTLFLGAILQWTIAGVLLARERKLWVVCALLLAPAQLLIAGRHPTLALLAGAAVGSIIALTRLRPSATAAIALVLVAAWQLAPFQPGDPHPVAWIPLADLMEGDRAAAVSSTFTKLFAYAGTIALLLRAGWRLVPAAAVLIMLLAVTEAVQTRLAERTPATTDPVIAAIGALALSRLRKPV